MNSKIKSNQSSKRIRQNKTIEQEMNRKSLENKIVACQLRTKNDLLLFSLFNLFCYYLETREEKY